jgi:sugar/nucleoside kinase (ribokinase family)
MKENGALHARQSLCCIGHITRDKIITPAATAFLSGGTAYYFSHAVARLPGIDYFLLTAGGPDGMAAAEKLREAGVKVRYIRCEHSVFFENIYSGDNQDDRRQRVLAKAAPFTAEAVAEVNADVVHLGALLADDFSTEVIQKLAKKSLVSVDAQGFLREVRGTDVAPVDWRGKKAALPAVHFLKANEHELEALTGTDDAVAGAKKIFDWGVREVIITLGSRGSIVYDGARFTRIPAYAPSRVVDATGAGDTYMAGYLCRRIVGAGIEDAGTFGAAMATLKIEHTGCFDKTEAAVYECMKTNRQHIPAIGV